MTPRGIRNNNPGNIRKSAAPWQGLAEVQDDPSFLVFSAPVWGLRAIAKILLNYEADDGCSTIREVVNRWAPPVENNTGAYVTAVIAELAQIGDTNPDAPISLCNAPAMSDTIKAIVQHENGEQPYGDDVIGQALTLAGIVPTTA